MSQYYSVPRKYGLFNPKSKKPFPLSRSKLDLFLNCRRCFYLDRRLGVHRPPGYPFSLNSAVDKLLKKEFDFHRAKGQIHPLMKAYKIDAVPFQHPEMDRWRNNRIGIRYLDKSSNFLVYGAIDDVWVRPNGELMIVDYKATAKNGEITMDDEWKIGYKRQMEIYQWLFRKNGFKVSATGYFVYCNGKTDNRAFDRKLEFEVNILPYRGDDSWVSQALLDARACLESEKMPPPDPECDFCHYRKAIKDQLRERRKID